MEVDRLHRQRIKKECAVFKEAIRPYDVCALASAYRGLPCHIFDEARSGSYNVCFFVEFDDAVGAGESSRAEAVAPSEEVKSTDEYQDGTKEDGSHADPSLSSAVGESDAEVKQPERWVVRFPLPSVHKVREKLDSEVATMRYVARHTDIPIPRVHGYALGQDEINDGVPNPTRRPFILMDHVQGIRWHGRDLPGLAEDKKKRFYGQLVHIYGQLRLQEFPAIGSLFLDDEPADGPGWRLGRPLSLDLNDQGSEGHDPDAIIDRVYKSSVEFCFAQYRLLLNMFQKQRNSVEDEDDAREKVFIRERFREILFGWIHPDYNYGPFVLLHGDLRPSNIVIDEDFNIKSIIDWEWSRTVPLQFFVPPTWNTGYDAHVVAMAGSGYQGNWFMEGLNVWRAVLRSMRLDAGVALLYREWGLGGILGESSRNMLASALLRFGGFDEIFLETMQSHFGARHNSEMMENFFKGSQNKGLLQLVAQKVEDNRRYQAELNASEISITDPEQAANGSKGQSAVSGTKLADAASVLIGQALRVGCREDSGEDTEAISVQACISEPTAAQPSKTRGCTV